jgi:hypothetical protein
MTTPDVTPVPLSPERLTEIRSTLLGDWLAGGWRVRNVTSTDCRDRSEVFLPDATTEDTVIASFPDWADSVAVFLADAHEAVPELLAEVDRLSKRVADLEASLPSRSASTPLRVEQHLTRVLDEDVHLRYQQAIGDRAVSEAARDIRMETNALKAHGVLEHDKFRPCRDAARQIERGGPYPSALVRFGCGAEVTS